MGKCSWWHEQLYPLPPTPIRKWRKGNTNAFLASSFFSFFNSVCDFGLWCGVIHIWDRPSLLRHIQRCTLPVPQTFLTLIKSIVKIKLHTVSLHKGIERPGRNVYLQRGDQTQELYIPDAFVCDTSLYWRTKLGSRTDTRESTPNYQETHSTWNSSHDTKYRT